MYGCESWTIKKADIKELMLLNCDVEDLRVPWTARRSNQSILKEISPEYSLEGLTLKLKLQYFGHLMWRTDSLEKTVIMGKIEGRRGREQQRMSWLDGITNLMGMSLNKTSGVGDGQGRLACCSPWGRKESDMTEQLNWTTIDTAWTCQKSKDNSMIILIFYVKAKETQQERGVFSHLCGLEIFLFLSLRQHYRLDLFSSCSITVTERGDSFVLWSYLCYLGELQLLESGQLSDSSQGLLFFHVRVLIIFSCYVSSFSFNTYLLLKKKCRLLKT